MVEQGYAKGRRKREAIIAAATALFAEVGYRSASLREISARSGLSHPGLLHHFATKEALLLAVLDQRDRDDAAQWPAPSSDGRARLRGLVDIVERNTRRRGIVELFSVLSAEATAADHPAHDYFVARYRAALAGAESAYADLAERRLLRPGVTPAVAARQLIALTDGLQVQWLLDASTDMVGAVRAQIDAQLVGGLEPSEVVPRIRQTVIDCPDARALGDFYAAMFGFTYRPGDETGDADWLVLRGPGGPALALQQIDDYRPPTWPHGERPAMLHLDTTVSSVAELMAQRDRALALGATELFDRSADAEEPLFVLADPAGHPFCVFVS